VVPDRILVKFKQGQSSAHVDGALSRARVNRRKSFRASGVSLLEVRGRGRSVHDVVKELEDSGVVEYAHPDHVVHADTVPSDPLFPQLWGLHNPADSSPSSGACTTPPTPTSTLRKPGTSRWGATRWWWA
jgi:hypothetical protein